MASQPHTWIVAAILLAGSSRLSAEEPVVRFSGAPRLLIRPTAEILPVSSSLSVAGAATACDDLAWDACDAGPECAPSCQTCGGCGSAGCCCSFWTVSAEAMYLRRSNGWDQILVTDQTSGATRLSTSDFDDDYAVIPRLQIIRQRPDCHGWDVNMFGITSFESEPLSGGFFSPQLAAPGTALPSTAPGTVFRSSYETEFDSIEVNYRRSCYRHPYLTLIAGFRWLDLSDQLDVDQVAPLQRDLFSIDTNNRMYGLQTGLDAVLWRGGPRFYIDSMVRAGVFYNRADQTTYAPLFSGLAPIFVDQLSAQDNHTSFFSELGFHGVYRMTDRLSLRAGYRLMWLEGAALAPNQIPVNSLVGPGTAALDTDGSLFLDGATVGASYTY